MEVYRPRVPPERVEQLRRDRAAEFDYRRTFASRPRGDGDLLRPLPYWMSLIAGGLGGMGAVVGQRAISGGLLWRRVAQTVPVELRTRRDSDLDACELLARAVHAVDGYPPRFADDLRLFVSVPDALGVWVAESDRGIVGHVALQPTSSRAVMALASDATGRPPDRFDSAS